MLTAVSHLQIAGKKPSSTPKPSSTESRKSPATVSCRKAEASLHAQHHLRLFQRPPPPSPSPRPPLLRDTPPHHRERRAISWLWEPKRSPSTSNSNPQHNRRRRDKLILP